MKLDDGHALGVSHDRRECEPGVYFTKRQLMAWALVLFGAATSSQVAINVWAFDARISQHVSGGIKHHNTDPAAHALALLSAEKERSEILRQLAEVKTAVTGIHEMLTVIANQGRFNVEAPPPRKR